MNKILSIKHIMGFIVFAIFVLGFTTPSFALICKSGKVQCCPGGVQSCCDPIPCTSSPCQDYDISCWGGDDPISDDPIVGPISDDPIVPLCTTGQKKYTASGCSYSTQTCCSGSWCDGDTTCATCTNTSQTRDCSGNVPTANGGTQKRTRSVTSYCGSCTYGSWSNWRGTCTCYGNYIWDNSLQQCKYNYGCSGQGSCYSQTYQDPGTCYCCPVSAYLVSGSGDSRCGLQNTCCQRRFSGGGIGETYYLPLGMSSCEKFRTTFNLSGTMTALACSIERI